MLTLGPPLRRVFARRVAHSGAVLASSGSPALAADALAEVAMSRGERG
jgi:hypothetical protein